MTGEEMERAIQFLIEHHARVSTSQDRNTANIGALTRTVVELAESVSRLEAQAENDRREMRERFEMVSEEMRDRYNKMILGNEVTRDLANQIGRLAVATSQRVTALEGSLP